MGKVGQSGIRVSGKIYSVDEVIDEVVNMSVTPATSNKIGSVILFSALFSVLSYLGCPLGGVGSVVFALLVHEIGHYVGMRLAGWPRAGIVVGIFGPLAVGAEGISAGRKAIVAISGPAFGLLVGLFIVGVHLHFDSMIALDLARALFLLTAINLLPFKPFDGAVVIEHLLFARHPKVQMGCLIAEGLFLVLMFVALMYRDLVFLGVIFCFYGMAMFMGAKKIDNMSAMVVRLRKEAVDDFKQGRYAPATIVKMQYSLLMFDLPNQAVLTAFLRELWDEAWEVQASVAEIFFVVTVYAMLVLTCIQSPVTRELFAEILTIVGL